MLINRIKKHTEFEHEFESGLLKMMAIGLGKQAGAAMYHQAMLTYGYAKIIQSIARKVMQKANILLGVGIVENGFGQTAKIGICSRENIEEQEIALLTLAKELTPALPFDEADIIVIDEMGKDISGTGFDTKVVGRIGLPLVTPDPEYPKIMRIKNTSCLSEVDVSEGYQSELLQRDDLEIIREKFPLEFDSDGNLLLF